MGNIKGSYNRDNKFNAKYSEEDIENMYREIIEHFTSQKTIHLHSYPLSKGKSSCWINKMCEDHPRIAQAMEQAKNIISQKIVNMSFYDRKVNAWAGHAWLGIYSPEFREHMKFKAELNKQSQPEAQHQCAFNSWAVEQAKSKEKLDPK